MPYCEKCAINRFCLKQCLGSQYETHRDMFESNVSVCNLYKTKVLTLYNLLKENKIFDYVEENKVLMKREELYFDVMDFKYSVEKLLQEEGEFLWNK